jgi:amino acid transporter
MCEKGEKDYGGAQPGKRNQPPCSFSLIGYARLATLGEEVHDPKKTILRAIVISLVIAMLLYFLVALVAVGSIGAVAMAESISPIEPATRYQLDGICHGTAQ